MRDIQTIIDLRTIAVARFCILIPTVAFSPTSPKRFSVRACIDSRAQLRNNMNEFTVVQDEKINTTYLMALSSTAPAVADATRFLVLAFGMHHSLFDLATARATRKSASKSLLGDGMKEELHSLVMGSYQGILEVHMYAELIRVKRKQSSKQASKRSSNVHRDRYPLVLMGFPGSRPKRTHSRFQPSNKFRSIEFSWGVDWSSYPAIYINRGWL
jgi:hypothetical protein